MTLAEFLTYVKQDFNRTDKDTEITRARNDAILMVSSFMPHGNYKYQSYIPTVIGQEDYPLPSDLVHLIHPVRLLEGSGTNDLGYPMNKCTKAEYDILEPNPNRSSPSTGKPTDYTIFSRSILLTPIPDKATYIIEINWSKRPVDSATCELGAEWDQVLKAIALDKLYAGIELFQEAQYWQNQYVTRDGGGNIAPIGLFKRLLQIEEEREGNSEIGSISVNSL